MKKIDKYVINQIMLAQWASTMAKTVDYFDDNKYCYYGIKEKCIKKALSILKGAKHSSIQYKIEEKADQNGYPSYVFYFEFQLKGKKYQFSFHQPKRNKTIKINGKQSIRWNGLLHNCVENYLEIKRKIGFKNETFYHEKDKIINLSFKKYNTSR